MKRIFVLACILGGISFAGVTSVNAYEEEGVPHYGYVYLNQGGNHRLNQDLLRTLYYPYNNISIPSNIKNKPNLIDFAEPKNLDAIFSNYGGWDNDNPSRKDAGYPFRVEDLESLKEYDGPGKAHSLSLDYLKYFKNLECADIVGVGATDFRPIENNKNLKELSIEGPISSTRFICKLKKLEQLTISAYPLDGLVLTDGDEDEFGEDFYDYKDTEINAITDITFLNKLDNLKDIEIESIDRDFPSIGLKKGNSKYQLVNPFLLSKQFNGADIEITSDTGEFKFENNILTWENINPEAEFLNVQWNVVKEDYSYRGNSRIPIHWVD